MVIKYYFKGFLIYSFKFYFASKPLAAQSENAEGNTKPSEPLGLSVNITQAEHFYFVSFYNITTLKYINLKCNFNTLQLKL